MVHMTFLRYTFQLASRHVGILGIALVLASTGSCAQAKTANSSKAQVVERSFASMGSQLHLSVWTTDPIETASAFDMIEQEFRRLEDLMSNWRDASDIQKLNAAAGDHPVPVAPEIRELLRTANQVSEWTNGKFDVTFGVMSGLWKFDYQNEDETIPDPMEVARRRKLINYRDLKVDEQRGTAFLAHEGMVANLGGIGKGYAVDRARNILQAAGFRNFMIQFGGDMYVAGNAGDRPWRLGIQDPRGTDNHIFASIELSDSTFSTSGDYERFFIKDGRRYHHIIDPATGEPSIGCRSVTIVGNSATIADGLSTGVFIMGPEAGMALIEKLPDVEGVIVSSKNEVLVSSGLKGRLTVLAQPTDAP
jgi:thiamine biosynthesis lipoprotein